MTLRYSLTLIAGLVLLAGLAGGQQLASAQNTDNGSTAVSGTLASVNGTHQELSARFRGLWSAAVGPRASVHDRVSFLRFLHAEVVVQLDREGIVLYPVFDSLTNGAYATTAALFDRQAIGRLVNELGDSVAYRDLAVFNARSYALAVALESYFTKTEFLVLPVVKDRLTEEGIRALVARLEGARTKS